MNLSSYTHYDHFVLYLDGAKTSATTAYVLTTAKTIKQTSNYITSTKPNLYLATGSEKQKAIVRSSSPGKIKSLCSI